MTFMILMFERGILECKPDVAYLSSDSFREALDEFDKYREEHTGYYLYFLTEVIDRVRT